MPASEMLGQRVRIVSTGRWNGLVGVCYRVTAHHACVLVDGDALNKSRHWWPGENRALCATDALVLEGCYAR